MDLLEGLPTNYYFTPTAASFILNSRDNTMRLSVTRRF
jgi:hypothetical protein